MIQHDNYYKILKAHKHLISPNITLFTYSAYTLTLLHQHQDDLHLRPIGFVFETAEHRNAGQASMKPKINNVLIAEKSDKEL